MLITAADRAEILRAVDEAEAEGRADQPLMQVLRRIARPKGMLQMTLPYPISANRYWQTRVMPARNGKPAMALTYVSSEAKTYKASVAWLLAAAGVRRPYAGRIAAHIQLYPHRPKDWATRARKDPLWADSVQRLDLDNCRKVITDSLLGVAVVDDKQLHLDGGEVMEPDGRDACVVLTIWPLLHAPAQVSLMAPEEPASLTAPLPQLQLSDYTEDTPF